MFGIGMPEMLMILAVALIVIGPKKLPDLARSLGRAMGEFKRAASDLKDSIQSETGLDEVRDSFKEVKADVRDALTVNDPPAANDGIRNALPVPEPPETSGPSVPDSAGSGQDDADEGAPLPGQTQDKPSAQGKPSDG